MAGAFQFGAFQSSAFQETLASGVAFQRGAFQNNAFQKEGTSSTPTYSGGWEFPERKRKTRAEIERERIALGIIPAPIKRIVEKQARRVVAKATKQADASPTQPDPIAWLERNQAQQKAILARELKERQIESRRFAYMTLLRVEVEALMLQRQEAQRAQDEEDEQIVMLLMEL